MPALKCPTCEFTTADVGDAAATWYLNNHYEANHKVETSKLPKLPQPRIGEQVSRDRWEIFASEWDSFRLSNGLNTQDSKLVNTYLLQSCDRELKESVLKQDPKIAERTPAEALDIVKSLAVAEVAENVAASELFVAAQEAGETGRSFAARLRGKARLCGFKKKCTCDPAVEVNYENEIVQKIFLSGLREEDIRKEEIPHSVRADYQHGLHHQRRQQARQPPPLPVHPHGDLRRRQ